MRILWHCEDRAGVAMAGPAIRAVELCARLAGRHEVSLACPGAAELTAEFGRREQPAGASVRALLAGLRAGDTFITQGFGFPLRDLSALPAGVRLVLDLYDPVQLELLARYGSAPRPEERLHLARVRRRLLILLSRADHVLCASPRQRAFWLGWLGAAGRLTSDQLAGDPTAATLLAVVPFGIEALPEVHELQHASPLRAAHAVDESPILWWGGLWDWMDPLTAIRAVDLLRKRGVKAALVLPAGNRPGAAPMAVAAEAEREARARGLWGQGRGVAQLPAWLPYGERRAALSAAALAVSCHRPSLEAELAFRTRLLDCVWAGLPAVATEGDELSERAAREGWALTVAPGDADALAAGLEIMLAPDRRQAARDAAERARPAYSWDRSAAVLLALLDKDAPARRRAAGWGPLGDLVPELAGEGPLAVARAAVGKLAERARRGKRS